MKTNQQIAKLFDQVADLLEFQGESTFRFRGYRNAADLLRGLDVEIAELIADPQATFPADLSKAMLERCREVVTTGRLQPLEEIARVVPLTVLDILEIPKLGPKKASQLFRELGIANIGQLREACLNQQIRTLAGFGAKSEQTILAGINQLSSNPQRWLWASADELVNEWSRQLSNCPCLQQFQFTGDYRRRVELLDELYLLVETADPLEFLDWLAAQFAESQVRIAETTLSLSEFANRCRAEQGIVPAVWTWQQADCPPVQMHWVTSAQWTETLVQTTGSAAHWQALLPLAPTVSSPAPPLVAPRDAITTPTGNESPPWTEVAYYRSRGLDWIPPELREGLDEVVQAQNQRLPHLIECSDIRGDLHSHTTATDGSASLEEMAAAAQARGLKYLAITDHSKRVAMARGLDSDRLLAQWKQIDRWNHEHSGEFRLLKGIECDILENGDMDLPDDVLEQGDWIIASIHYGQQQSREQITDRLLRAIKNPHVDQIAHPTGRLLNRRPPYQVDMDAVMQAAVEFGKCLELNASPKRLDLHVEHLRQARLLGIPIVINTDAHSPRGLDAMRYGINQARRAGLSAADVLNCRALEDWLPED